MGANDLSLTKFNFKVNFEKLMPNEQISKRNTRKSDNLDFFVYLRNLTVQSTPLTKNPYTVPPCNRAHAILGEPYVINGSLGCVAIQPGYTIKVTINGL